MRLVALHVLLCLSLQIGLIPVGKLQTPERAQALGPDPRCTSMALHSSLNSLDSSIKVKWQLQRSVLVVQFGFDFFFFKGQIDFQSV